MLLVTAPVFLAIATSILVASKGEVFVRVPHRRRDGSMAYRTEFRTRRSFDVETYDELTRSPDRWRTSVGEMLRRTRIARLPVLLDIRAGRLGFIEGLFD